MITCPHCQSNLPDGLEVCFRCGKSLIAEPAPVPDLAAQASEQTSPELETAPVNTCPHCGSRVPPGLQMCFRCGKPFQAASEPPAQGAEPAEARPRWEQPTPPIRGGPKPGGRQRALALIAVALVLVLGVAVGGHFMGMYSLPILPELADEIEVADAPSASVSNAPAAADSSSSTSARGQRNLGDPDETGFIHAAFGFNNTDNTITAISAVHIDIDPTVHSDLHFSDFSDFKLTRDGIEQSIAFIETIEQVSYYEGETGHYMFRIATPLTEQGEYAMTFTLFGKTREVTGGERLGEPVKYSAESSASSANPPAISEPPDIEFTVDGVVLMETTIDEVKTKYSSLPDYAEYTYGRVVSNKSIGVTVLRYSFKADEDSGKIIEVTVQDAALGFLLLGKYHLDEATPALFMDFTGIDDYRSLEKGDHILFDDGNKRLEVAIQAKGYVLKYTQGDKWVKIAVSNDKVYSFNMGKVD